MCGGVIGKVFGIKPPAVPTPPSAPPIPQEAKQPEATKSEAIAAGMSKQKKAAAAFDAKRGTVLTGMQGLTDTASTARKSLLGL